jgi:nitronate monooxygenase
MALDPKIRRSLVLPAICAPMFLVTNTAMVKAACRAGIMGALPHGNFRDFDAYLEGLKDIFEDLRRFRDERPDAIIGPVAANLRISPNHEESLREIRACRALGVELFITAVGDPTEMIKRVHGEGGRVFHDVTSIRFAEKAIAAKADGLTAIGAGGGGHSGTVSHLALVPKIRSMFDGTIVLAGAVSTGAAIRAAEVLGADLAYLGTRFIATQESGAPQAYKDLLVSQAAKDVLYTPAISGIPANWLKESLRRVGLDPDNLPKPAGIRNYDHLPPDVRPWRDVWSASQGIELIGDIPAIADLVLRLRREYVAACEVPSFVDTARL